MKTAQLLCLILFLISLIACKNDIQPISDLEEIGETIEIDSSEILTEEVLTAEEQARLSADSVLTILKHGNSEFTSDALTIRNTSSRIRKAVAGQYPKAVILSCLDSRVPVEDIFHRGIGDIFVARVAGNVVNEDILGSLEYACKVSGAKLVVVLGHNHCGAIKSAIQNVKLGNITGLLSKINPAIEASAPFYGDKTAYNKSYVTHVCIQNIKLGVENIRKNSTILKEMEMKGEIKMVGAFYELENGRVSFFN